MITVIVDEKILKKEMVMLTLIEILLIVYSVNGSLSRYEGGILILVGILFIAYIVRGSQNPEQEYSDEDLKIEPKKLPLQFVTVIVSLLGLVFGGHFIVTSSTAVAEALGIANSAIGLTLIALGTTMPELVTTIAAARRKEDDIILGNIIGSNIFNILLVLGTAAFIHPIPISFKSESILSSLGTDLGIMFVLNMFLYFTMVKNRSVRWTGGIVLIAIYIFYMTKQIYFMMPH